MIPKTHWDTEAAMETKRHEKIIKKLREDKANDIINQKEVLK